MYILYPMWLISLVDIVERIVKSDPGATEMVVEV